MNRPTKADRLSTTQPPDWIEAFERQASLEGLTLSEWVGMACLKALPFSDEAEWSPSNAMQAHGLSPRIGRGRPQREVAK